MRRRTLFTRCVPPHHDAFDIGILLLVQQGHALARPKRRRGKGAAAVRACVREPDIPQVLYCIIVLLHLLGQFHMIGLLPI